MRSLWPALAAVLLASAPAGCTHRVVAPTPGLQGQPREEPPPGMVEVSVVSEYEDQAWDLHAGGSVVCTTPCTQWFGAGQGLLLAAGDGDKLYVPGLGLEAMESRHAFLV